jgi:hypothetical protein
MVRAGTQAWLTVAGVKALFATQNLFPTILKLALLNTNFRTPHLTKLQYSQASMFPDLSGLGADIEAEFIKSWRPLPTI